MLHKEIPKLLVSETETGFGGTDLYKLARHFLFGGEIDQERAEFRLARLREFLPMSQRGLFFSMPWMSGRMTTAGIA
jgi:hypothetical protein